ncbi:hypothetical protein KGQ64_04715 [bacterium]|nr:hypothetical protein [bacterium]
MSGTGGEGGSERRNARRPAREVGGSFFRLGQSRSSMGGASLAFLLLAAPALSACTSTPRVDADAPRIDMSSDESAARTMERLQKSLTAQQLNEFNQATLALVRQELEVGQQENKLDPQKARVAVKKVLDGKTAAEVVAAARGMSPPAAAAH